MKSLTLTLCLAAVAALTAPARADNYKFPIPHDPVAPAVLLDEGDFRVMVGGRTVATEHFAWSYHRDSLLVTSEFVQRLADGDSILKHANVIVRAFDYDLNTYQSVLFRSGRQLGLRALTRGDTVITAFREANEQGEGVTYLSPPGRTFALEPMSLSLIDVIARYYGGRGLDSAPINLFVVGNPDTIQSGVVRLVGTEALRWGARPVTARKFALAVGPSQFLFWVAPQGWMLRAEMPADGITVERVAAPVKRAAPPKPRPGSSAAPAAPSSK